MDLGVKVEGTTKTANRRQEVLHLLLPKPGASPELKIQSTLKDMCVWQGKEFPSNALPPEDVVRQILWELYELNFIHELVSLDHHACAELDAACNLSKERTKFHGVSLLIPSDISLLHQKIVD